MTLSMFNTAAARRTSCALIRNPRTPTLSSRSFAFSNQPRPLQHIPRSRTSNPSSQLRQSLNSSQSRSLSYFQRTKIGLRRASKGVFRNNPVTVSLLIAGIIGSVSILAYVAYVEVTHNAPQFHRYPKAVTKCLRKAVYYTDVDLQPQYALKAYKEALAVATQLGMHPYSDEVLGIKLQVAKMLEMAGLVEASAKVYERTREEMLTWVADGRKQALQRKEAEARRIKEQGKIPAQNPEINDPQDLEALEMAKETEEFEQLQRDKAVKKAVGVSIKLATLYDSDHIQDSKKAEAAIEAAVELSLKELQYRQSLGFPINGGDGDDMSNKDYLTQTEATIALIRLADIYVQSESNNVELAIPLYLRALELIRAEEGPKASCKQVLLMTNLATAMGARSQLPFRVQDPDAARIQTSDAARQWALKAVEVYGNVPESEKDDNCHLCRAAAMNWLGQFAEHHGKLEEASKWYNDSLAGLKKSAQRSDYPDYRMAIGDTEKLVKRASGILAGK